MYRVLFISDLHKRYKDLSTIKGLIGVQQKIQEDIIDFIKANGVTHVIIGGDWYDRGYHGLGPAYGAIEMDRRLSEAVNGEVYLCIGNHFYLERDENPEMYIIQPNEYIHPQVKIPVPDKPIFKLVPQLLLGTVQIDFFHFNKVDKTYKAFRRPETTFHIGVYHDDVTLPSIIKEQDGYRSSSSHGYLCDIYKDIDLALHGHIHCKIGIRSLELDNGRKVPLVVPGSLCPTQNKAAFKHTDVQCPVIDIDEDSNVQLKLATFSTHLPELQFFEGKKKATKTMDNIVYGNESLTTTKTELYSLPTFLQKKGYRDVHMKLVDAALGDYLNLYTALSILMKEGENEDGEDCI